MDILQEFSRVLSKVQTIPNKNENDDFKTGFSKVMTHHFHDFKRISDYAKGTEFYMYSKANIKSYANHVKTLKSAPTQFDRAATVFYDLLNKIDNAPQRLHCIALITLLLPPMIYFYELHLKHER